MRGFLLLVAATAVGGCGCHATHIEGDAEEHDDVDGADPGGCGECDDLDPCTVDRCTEGGECVHEPRATSEIVELGEPLDIRPDWPFLGYMEEGLVYATAAGGTHGYGSYWSLHRIDPLSDEVDGHVVEDACLVDFALRPGHEQMAVLHNECNEIDCCTPLSALFVDGWLEISTIPYPDITCGDARIDATDSGYFFTHATADGRVALLLDALGGTIAGPTLLFSEHVHDYDQIWAGDRIATIGGEAGDILTFTEDGESLAGFAVATACSSRQELLSWDGESIGVVLRCSDPEGPFSLHHERFLPDGTVASPAVLVHDELLRTSSGSIRVSEAHGSTLISWYVTDAEDSQKSRICSVPSRPGDPVCVSTSWDSWAVFLEAEGTSLWALARSGMPRQVQLHQVCVPGVTP